ncbi:MAG: O-antigen ligase family protein, partial [Candidatus Entotheonellia bacterium]
FIVIAAVTGLRGAVEGVAGSGREYVRATAEAGIQAAGNPNRLAFFAEVGIALLWYYPQEGRSRWPRLLRMAMIPGLAVTVLLAASRSGLMNLVLLFGLLVIGERFSVKRQLQTVLVLSLSAYLAVSLVTPAHIGRLENLFPGGSIMARGTRSVEGRTETLESGWEMIAREPLFGIGLGNFMWVHLQISGRRTPSHNSYLWAAAEGGIPTLLLYLVLFGLTFKNLVQVERKARHPGLREVARGLRTSLLVFLSFSFFAEFWHNIIAYVLVGLAIVLRRLQEAEPVSMQEGDLQADAPDVLASRGAGVSPA